jgi:hypothetical protein
VPVPDKAAPNNANAAIRPSSSPFSPFVRVVVVICLIFLRSRRTFQFRSGHSQKVASLTTSQA